MLGSVATRCPALQVIDLSVGFDRTNVIERLSFEVAHGSALAIIGPNGAGKSVLAKALIGALPCEGTITWEANTKLGYVPQKLDIERDLPIPGGDFQPVSALASRLRGRRSCWPEFGHLGDGRGEAAWSRGRAGRP
jgi:ABC-type Mn2+/Zn2+ transport system ATPase subunit